MVSSCLDFRHKMSVQRSPSPDRRGSEVVSSRHSSLSHSPPDSPDSHHHLPNKPALHAITISNSLCKCWIHYRRWRCFITVIHAAISGVCFSSSLRWSGGGVPGISMRDNVYHFTLLIFYDLLMLLR